MLSVPQTSVQDDRRRVRIVMEVDAWVPVAAVTQAYRQVQRQLLPGHNRPIGSRSIELVNFVLRNPLGSWEKRLEAWNNAHPDATYSGYRHMRSSYVRARESLELPRYHLYAGPGSRQSGQSSSPG